jgi:lipopolysaccharide cholinephosphotransferase
MYYKSYCHKKVDKNFVEVINLLNFNKINYWLCHGTLLGFIREKNLIPWDNDIDIAILETNFNIKKINYLMLSHGFKRKVKFIHDNLMTYTKGKDKEVDINCYRYNKNFNNIYVRWYSPANIFMKIIDAITVAKNYDGKFKIIINLLYPFQEFFIFLKKILCKYNFFYKKKGYSHPVKFIKLLKKEKFMGIEVKIPYFYKEYLLHLYGKSWKIPKKNFNWSKDSPATILIK